ncbi:MAG: penicillin-binding protein 1C [Lewinella sp.]|nr:penicillin-binding protein 1C [Lewinella sp.]
MLKRFPRSRWLLVLLPLLVWWWWSLPRPLFDAPLSLVLEDEGGQLVGARIASDGQWRFPVPDSLPDKFAAAIVAFEDQRFYRHPGVDVLALARALRQNLRAGSVVSGGSTLSMQVIRLARGNPPRTLWQKSIEILLALRLDLTYRKSSILRLWSAYAPFGGNVVGLEAATWRYYGKSPQYLSWGEAATLAVLPNSPALIHPGRNQDALRQKRDRLLDRLLADGQLDSTSCRLAQMEPLPEAPRPLPQWAPHLLARIGAEEGPGRYTVTLDLALQQRLTEVSHFHHQRLAGNGIHNLAVLVVEVNSGRTLAYLGNAPEVATNHSPAVDIITAPRSPGSLLKPLLYSLSLQQGRLLPGQLLPDVPTVFGGFRPENYYEDFSGAVPARRALARSLNIPFVHLLQDYGVPGFHHALQEWGFSYVNQPPGHYGLSLILGGCEVSLWQVTGWYASVGRMLNSFYPRQGQYAPTDWRPPHYLTRNDPTDDGRLQDEPSLLGAGAAWLTAQAMRELERPDSEGEWEYFPSSRRLSWKTGTSFGFRDAWAVGFDGDYAIGVWAGNADGEGRPGLVGVQAAAPLLFAVANSLPPSRHENWEQPFDDMEQLAVCRESGYPASPYCPVDTAWVPRVPLQVPPCPYHQRIFLTPDGAYRVQAECSSEGQPVNWFSLPPLEAYYYRQEHPTYRDLPPWRPDCRPAASDEHPMQLVYPRHPGRIQVPIQLDGTPSATVFSVAHRRPDARIYWHLDASFLGVTHGEHSWELAPPPGPHRLVLIDDQGVRLEQDFEIVAE